MNVSESRRITLHALMYEVIPQLNAAERILDNTLLALIEASDDPLERIRREEQRDALRLELFTIRLNVEHLLKRYSGAVGEAKEGRGESEGTLLELDEGEANAIEKARKFYQRLVELRQEAAR